MKTIRAIIFDLDETLMYESMTEHKAYAECCAWILDTFGVKETTSTSVCDTLYTIAADEWSRNPVREFTSNVGISSMEGLWGSFTGPCEEFEILGRFVKRYRQRCLSRLIDQFDIDVSQIDGIIDRSIAIRNRYHVPFDDTIAVLKELRTRYTLGLLTNGAPEVQRAKLRGAQISPFFEHVVVSGDLCVGKPATATFEKIVRLTDESASACLMVGDSYEKDVVGARRFGMNGVLVDRFSSQTPENETVLHNLSGLASFIDLNFG